MKYFSRPLTLCKLARFLREAWISSVRPSPPHLISHLLPFLTLQNKRARDYPFILSAPVDLEKGN